MTCKPENSDSVNVLIFADRRVTSEDISKLLEISERTAQKLCTMNFAFSKFS